MEVSPWWNKRSGKSCTLQGTHTGAVLEELQPVGSPWSICEGLNPVGGTLHWNRGRKWPCRSSRDKVLWTDITYSPSPCAAWGEEVVECGREGEGVFSFLLALTVLVCYQQAINYIILPCTESVLLFYYFIYLFIISEQSPHLYLNPWAFFIIFFFFIVFYPPAKLRKGSVTWLFLTTHHH